MDFVTEPGESYLGDDDEIDVEFGEAFFRGFVLSGLAASLARRAATDESWLEWSASLSYRHHLDFDKVVVAKSARSGRKLVWHRWADPTPLRVPGSIEAHNHRWDFFSFVVSGGLRAIDFEVEGTGSDRQHFVYHSPGGGDVYDMQHSGSAGLRVMSDAVYEAGTFYFQDRQKVHVALASARETSTLIVQDAVGSETTDVFSPFDEGETVTRFVERFSLDGVRAALLELSEMLPKG